MRDEEKTKKQLLGELAAMRQRVVELEALEAECRQVKEALRESEERYHSVVENSNAGILIVDDAYRFVYVNDELCRILGYQRGEIIGQDFRRLLDEESRGSVVDRYIRRQRGEDVPSRHEFNIARKDGEKRRMEISSTLIQDSAGNARTVGQLLDITERKQAEWALQISETRYRRLFETAKDGILILDAE